MQAIKIASLLQRTQILCSISVIAGQVFRLTFYYSIIICLMLMHPCILIGSGNNVYVFNDRPSLRSDQVRIKVYGNGSIGDFGVDHQLEGNRCPILGVGSGHP